MKYFDLHCDTISDCYQKQQSLYDGNLQISLQHGAAYSPWVQCFAVWIPDEVRGKAAFDYFDTIYEHMQKELQRYSDHVMLCKTAADLQAAIQQKKVGAVLTVEGGAAVAGDMGRLRYLAQCGVKVMTLTWNSSCEIGDGAGVASPKGLTEFGRQAVQEMERVNMVVDVSHASDPLFEDVAAYTSKPFIATHSNSRAVCNHKRNLTDDQFRVIRKRGGLVGMTFAPGFLNDSETPKIEDVLRHTDHFLSLGGERCLAIGGDFDGTPLPDGMTGIESVETLAELMLRHNYSECLVNSILFDNAYQFFLSLL